MIIAFAGQKGGAGKSCGSICVAAEGHARGLRTLLIDADPQGTARTWRGVAMETGRDAPNVMVMGENLYKEIPKLAADHDLVVIDCPPRHSEIQRAALLVADTIVLPCNGSSSDAWALMSTLKLIEEARKRRPHVDVRILLNRADPRTAIGRGARDVLSTTGCPVMRAEMRLRIAYQEAIGEGLGVTQHAPKSEAASEVRALFDELVGTPAKKKAVAHG